MFHKIWKGLCRMAEMEMNNACYRHLYRDM